jgi:thiamine biosynthesis lipoprotein
VLSFEAIGAPWRITTPTELPEPVVAAIRKRIDEFDAVYSRFRDDSLIARIAEAPGRWRFPADAAPLFTLYRTLYQATSGAVSPLVGRRLEDLGYDRDYTLRPKPEPVSVPSWDEVMHWDGTTLTTTEPVVIDVGAAGKGYLADLVAGVLRDAGVEEYLIDASGDLVHRGEEPVRVGLEHPFDSALAIGVVELSNGSLCASAAGRRSWGDGLHHIIDGNTGEPTTTTAATWAMSKSGLMADGLATALFFTAAPLLSANFTFDYVRMFPDSRVEYSRSLPGEIFTAETSAAATDMTETDD